MNEQEILYLETEAGQIPLSPEMVAKYNLKKGIFSSFTNYKIVDQSGAFTSETPPKEQKPKLDPEEKPGDGIVEMDNGMQLSTSEILDLAAGADSDTEFEP